jgi:hypothetical protein
MWAAGRWARVRRGVGVRAPEAMRGAAYSRESWEVVYSWETRFWWESLTPRRQTSC